MSGLLIVTAVEAERAALTPALAGTGARVIVGGVGVAAAAAATSAALAADPDGVHGVLCAGIAGGFAPLEPGELAVASVVVFADLGAETAGGFRSASALGFGEERYPVDPQLAIQLADRSGAHLGTVLTTATVTGTAATAAALTERYPDTVAEAMEGAGVAAAAALHGVPFAELRAISNRVGPRDRDAWQIPLALSALATAVGEIAAGWPV